MSRSTFMFIGYLLVLFAVYSILTELTDRRLLVALTGMATLLITAVWARSMRERG
jgi:hypothetical protein